MSDIRTTLHIVLLLSEGEWSATSLAARVLVSVPTVKRCIAEARTMGAVIESVGGGKNPWYYRLTNWTDICHRVGVWTVLESSRKLTGPI